MELYSWYSITYSSILNTLDRESGPRGPGFEFTPEGCNLIHMEWWNDGIMETGNPLAGTERREASANNIGVKTEKYLYF